MQEPPVGRRLRFAGWPRLALLAPRIARHWWVGVCLSLLSCGGSSADPARSTPQGAARRVLLVTWDTTRADHLGPYDPAVTWTPNLDRLAQRGTVFEQARTVAPITLPSHVSMMTGVYPAAHGVRDNAIFAISDRARFLPEVLRERGFRTAAFVGSYVLDAKYGMAQGFETFTAPTLESSGLAPEVVERFCSEVVDDAETWLRSIEPDEPFFLWTHFWDPHWPHRVPDSFAHAFEDIYDAELAFCDQQLGRLLDILEERGLDEELLVILTADHGESFGEHRESTHGVFVYDATVHVPLILRPPVPGPAARRRVTVPVSITELAATILDYLGIDPETMPAIRPRSLRALAEGATPEDDAPLLLESFLPYYTYRWHALRGLVAGGSKLILGRTPELYDLRADPEELRDLAAERPELAAELRAMLEEVYLAQEPLGWEDGGAVDEEDRARLEALGYVTGSSGGDPLDDALLDPRVRYDDKAAGDEVLKLLQRARALMDQDRALAGQSAAGVARASPAYQQGLALLAEAAEIGKRTLADVPDNPLLNSYVGLVELSRREFAAAIPYLERSIAGRPQVIEPRYNLAVCYQMTGAPERAREEMLEVTLLEPRHALAWRWLSHAYESAGELEHGLYCVERLLTLSEIAPVERAALEMRARQLRERGALEPIAPARR